MNSITQPTQPAKQIRVLVVDDHPMIRKGLSAMVQAEPSMDWVGEASTGSDAITICERLKPDVVLLDLMMPNMDGATAAQTILQTNPDIHVLVLTSFYEPELVKRALQAGAVGYLIKTASSDELVRAIIMANSGQRVLAPEAADALVQAAQSEKIGHDLSEREREILALLAKGLSNAEIAGQIFVTVPTVKFHVTNILSKLHVDSRTEAVLVAMKHRLVPPI